MKEEFVKFLIKEGCAQEFVDNHLKYSERGCVLDCCEIGTSYINDIFEWDKTEEGLDFWALIKHKWIEIYNKKELMHEPYRYEGTIESIFRKYGIRTTLEEKENLCKNGKLLLKFLEERNIKDDFMRNFSTQNPDKKLNKFLNETDNLNYIVNAFTWCKADDGANYWNDIDIDWRNYSASNKSVDDFDNKDNDNENFSDFNDKAKLFLDFLEEKGAKEKFLKNIKENPIRADLTLKEYFEKNEPVHYVLNSFSWREVEGDFDYWERISDEWEKYLIEERDYYIDIKYLCEVGKQFIAFLETNNIKKKFIRNFKEDSDNEGTTLTSFINLHSSIPEEFVYIAFLIEETDEGASYWLKVDEKWKNKLKDLEVKNNPDKYLNEESLCKEGKLFIEFLKEHDSKEKFIENFKNDSDNDGTTITEYLNNTPSDLFLSCAFWLNKSLERSQYWIDINSKWYNKRKANTIEEKLEDCIKIEDAPFNDNFLSKEASGCINTINNHLEPVPTISIEEQKSEEFYYAVNKNGLAELFKEKPNKGMWTWESSNFSKESTKITNMLERNWEDEPVKVEVIIKEIK